MPILSLQPVTTLSLRNATSSVKPSLSNPAEPNPLSGPPHFSAPGPRHAVTWTHYTGIPHLWLCPALPQQPGALLLSVLVAAEEGREEGSTVSDLVSFRRSFVRRAPGHPEKLQKPRPAERVTSLALKPPEGHMSCSFLALPHEDITQQPLSSTRSTLLYSRKGQQMEASFLHCPWNLPGTTLSPTPVPVPCLQRANLGSPSDLSPALRWSQGSSQVGTGDSLQPLGPCIW